jgi:hypothetical protein
MNTVPGGPSPFRFPAIWDSLTLGGGAFTWSGRVDFVGAKRKFSWQHKSGPGVKGTVDTFRATHTNPFMMRIYVWTDAQWSLLPGLLEFFKYDGTKVGPDGEPLVTPVDIYHPQLTYLDIFQVLCEEILAPEVDKERTGAVWLPFRLHEFLPPIPAINATTTPVQTSVGISSQVTAGAAAASVALKNSAEAVAAEANVLGIGNVLP